LSNLCWNKRQASKYGWTRQIKCLRWKKLCIISTVTHYSCWLITKLLEASRSVTGVHFALLPSYEASSIAIIMSETRNCLFSLNSDLVIHLFTCKSCLQFRVWLKMHKIWSLLPRCLKQLDNINSTATLLWRFFVEMSICARPNNRKLSHDSGQWQEDSTKTHSKPKAFNYFSIYFQS